MKTGKMTYMKDGAIESTHGLTEIVAAFYDNILSHETHVKLLNNSVIENRVIDKPRLHLSYDYFRRPRFILGNGSDVEIGGDYFDLNNGEIDCAELMSYAISNEWRYRKNFEIRKKERKVIESIII